jgi:hypothetical protein
LYFKIIILVATETHIMKNIFAAIILICFAAAASAQVKPDAFSQRLNDLKLRTFRADTSISKLTLPTLTPNNYFKQELLPAINRAAFNSNMPVMHLVGTDNMPVAQLSAQDHNMLVKRFVLIDPSR